MFDKTKYQERYRIKSCRLPDYDYSQNGGYFITICTKNKEKYFGEIINEKVDSTEIGNIAKACWLEIPKHFPFVILDVVVVMPNHVHGILIIDKSSVETRHGVSLHQRKFQNIVSGSISSIINQYKGAVTRYANKKSIVFSWQSNYYENIIRNEISLRKIQEYILNNPMKWELDKFFV